MSNWLTVVIVLLIIAILAHGFRRTYIMRRNSLRLSPKMKKRSAESEYEAEPDAPLAAIIKSELPNGGARVIGYRDPLNIPQPRKKVSAKELREVRRKEEAAKRPPEQTRLNLNESVPILMESVDHQSTSYQSMPQQSTSQQSTRQQHKLSDSHEHRIEPTFSATVVQDEEDFDSEQPYSEHNKNEEVIAYDYEDHEGDYEENEDDEDDDWDDDEDGGEDDEEFDSEEDDFGEDDDWKDEVDTEPKTVAPAAPEPEEVIIINVMAFKGESFNGNDLLDVILKCGLRFGSMDIFHRYSDTKGEGVLLFSMANMVKPGTFDLDLMDDFETPGVSLFMTLPIDADSMQSFDLMVEAANTIADTLDGELKDEQRSAMTRQTIEHCRQRISEFERKKLFRRPR